QHAGALFFVDQLGGVVLKSSSQGIGVAGLEKYQILGRVGVVFSNGVVHTVLVEDTLEVPDTSFLNLDVGRPLVLPQKLLDALAAKGLCVGFLRPPLEELTGCRDDCPASELGSADGKVDCSVLYIFLHEYPPPFPPASGLRRKSRTMFPPQKLPVTPT